jgi:hypothetical protein
MKVISESGNPLKYVRKINEGGYVKTKRVLINQTIVFWLKIIKIETKNFVTPKYSRYIICVLLLAQLSQY